MTSLLTLLLYASFVVYQSLAGGGSWQCGGVVLATPVRVARSDALANIVAYIPLGLLWVLATLRPAVRTSRGMAAQRITGLLATGLLLIGLLSLGMELVQSCQAARVSSIHDLAANTLGGALGLTAGLVLWRIGGMMSTGAVVSAGATSLEVSDRRLRLATAGVAIAWVVSQTMPWVFAVDVGTIRSNLSFLRHWDGSGSLDLWRALRHAGAWMTVACAWRLVGPDSRHATVAFLITGSISLALQLLLDARAPLSFEELAGMAIAAALALPLLWHGRKDPRSGRWAMALWCCALVTVAAYQLRPEPAAATHAFSWWPRVGLGGRLGAIDYALLFGWFGLSTVAAAHWADRAGYRRARYLWPALAVLAMLGLELAQTAIPGRGPDISAPLFTLLALLGATAVLGDGRHPRA